MWSHDRVGWGGLTRKTPSRLSSRFPTSSIGTLQYSGGFPTCTVCQLTPRAQVAQRRGATRLTWMNFPLRFKSHMPVWIHTSAPEQSSTISIPEGPRSLSPNFSEMISACSTRISLSRLGRASRHTGTYMALGVVWPFFARVHRRREMNIGRCVLFRKFQPTLRDVHSENPTCTHGFADCHGQQSHGTSAKDGHIVDCPHFGNLAHCIDGDREWFHLSESVLNLCFGSPHPVSLTRAPSSSESDCSQRQHTRHSFTVSAIGTHVWELVAQIGG